MLKLALFYMVAATNTKLKGNSSFLILFVSYGPRKYLTSPFCFKSRFTFVIFPYKEIKYLLGS